MKLLTLTICAASFLLFACNNASETETNKDSSTVTTSDAAPSKKDAEWIPIDSATGMKAMMEYGTPGEPHKMLAKSDGNWNAETTMWWTPDGPPMKSNATASNKMIMGGRYQQGTFKGDMMGMPFEGHSLTGYDNAKKVYFTTWIDNMSTGIMQLEGPWNESTKTMELKGSMINPGNGQECHMREVFKIIDDNTQVMEMYGPDPATGKEFKTMEIKFTRKS
jgi:hypothetical protein